MSQSLCRLTVQSDVGAVDLALPRNTGVGLLLPSIVDLARCDRSSGRWRLAPVGGSPLDESMTLNEHDIRDGDLLVLTLTEAPTLRWRTLDPQRTVADAVDGRNRPHLIAVSVLLSSNVIGAVALSWSGLSTRGFGHLTAGAVLAVAAAVGALAFRRADEPAPSAALSVIAVSYAAVVGCLAVPAGPSAANALLSATAGFAAATVLLRLTPCGTLLLTAVATFAALAAAAATLCVVWTVPAATAGAALAVLSLAVLGLAARLSIAAAGLRQGLPAAHDLQVNLARQIMTGLVAGSSAAAVLGCLLVAHGDSPRSGAVFAAVVGVALLLRARAHAELARRIALGVGGLAGLAAALAQVVISEPGQAYWAVLCTAAGGSLALLHGFPVTPIVRRSVEMLEYLCLAAVLPLGCWVAGVYGLVRGLTLS